MKNTLIISILLTVLAFSKVFSQELSIAVTPYRLITAGNQFDAGSGGTALAISYRENFKGNFNWFGGLEAGTALWGTQLLADAGLIYEKSLSPVWAWEATAGLQQGIALFRPSPLYTFGITSTIGIQANVSKKSSLAFNTGLRYIFCPRFSSYSSIASSLQIPLSFSNRVKL